MRNTQFGNVTQGIHIAVLLDIMSTSILADGFASKALVITDADGVEHVRVEKAATNLRLDSDL